MLQLRFKSVHMGDYEDVLSYTNRFRELHNNLCNVTVVNKTSKEKVISKAQKNKPWQFIFII